MNGWFGHCATVAGFHLQFLLFSSQVSDIQTLDLKITSERFYHCVTTASIHLWTFCCFLPQYHRRIWTLILRSLVDSFTTVLPPLTFYLHLLNIYLPGISSETKTLEFGIMSQCFYHCATNYPQHFVVSLFHYQWKMESNSWSLDLELMVLPLYYSCQILSSVFIIFFLTITGEIQTLDLSIITSRVVTTESSF
jgi:hypothetical protein